jgi:ferritin-like metal-binding protein YciE
MKLSTTRSLNNMSTLRELYIEELQDLYDAENQILEALPKMADKASHPDLQRAFKEHLEQTRGHVQRLEKIFEGLEEKPSGKKCHGMQGLIEEGEELMKKNLDDDVLDAGLIAAAQKVEHYEMAGYGTVRTFARQLGEEDAANLLQETLNEEGRTDEKLTRLAENNINKEAAR